MTMLVRLKRLYMVFPDTVLVQAIVCYTVYIHISSVIYVLVNMCSQQVVYYYVYSVPRTRILNRFQRRRSIGRIFWYNLRSSIGLLTVCGKILARVWTVWDRACDVPNRPYEVQYCTMQGQ
jgi:hypothetical protein